MPAVEMFSFEAQARAPDATCATCGRRGTWAFIAHETRPPRIDRYCWRCWPVAQVVSEERATWAFLDAPLARQSLPPATHSAWHWLLMPGTLWRSYRQWRRTLRRYLALGNRTD